MQDKGNYCHECNKKIDSLIPFKCKHCGNLFCKDHFLPENHNCPNFKPKSIFSQLNDKPDMREPKPSYENTYEQRPKQHSNEKHKKYREHKKRKYTLGQTIKYKCRKAKIPVWFLATLTIMIVIAIIHQFYEIKILSYDISIVYYICEIVIVGYLMFRLLKKFDSIHVGSDLRLFGLRMLSGLVSLVGLFIFFFMMIVPLFALFDENMASIAFFGSGFNLHLTGTILFGTVGFGMTIIGAYLYFKFQRKTGNFVWFGRIR